MFKTSVKRTGVLVADGAKLAFQKEGRGGIGKGWGEDGKGRGLPPLYLTSVRVYWA